MKTANEINPSKLNPIARRVYDAFHNSKSVKHVLEVTIELPQIDARNQNLEDIVLEKLEELSGLRSLDVIEQQQL